MQQQISLVPLQAAQIEVYAQHPQQLFIQLGLVPHEAVINSSYIDFGQALKEALVNTILPIVKANPMHWELYTQHLVVDTFLHVCVGGIGCFINPDEPNKAHIGYYIYAGFEGKGYANAALAKMVEKLWSNTDIIEITATVPYNHTASRRVLERNGFETVELEGGIVCYRLLKK